MSSWQQAELPSCPASAPTPRLSSHRTSSPEPRKPVPGFWSSAETAEFLADKGREVTVVELRDGIALDMEYKTRQMLMPKLAALGVVCLTETEVLEIGCNGNVKVKTPYLEKELSGFDTVVVALGYRPDAALCADLAAADIDFVQVGDCKKVGKIINGVWEAFQLAYRI